MARAEYSNHAVDATGAVVASAAIEVRQKSDDSLATLYTTATGGTTKSNPFNAEADGSFEFFADQDRYDLTVGSGVTATTVPLDLVDARSFVGFESRADFVTAVAAGFAASDGAVIFADGIAYEALSGSAAISDLGGWRPWFNVRPDHFGSNTTPGTTDMTSAIQAAIDLRATLGGGNVEFLPEDYLISDTITVPQRIHLIGEGGWFKNQYSDTNFATGGTTIKLAAGSDVDMFLVRYDVAGGEVISDYRVHVSFRDMCIFGNRSLSQAPSAKDVNASGNGVTLSGVRYVDFHRVTIIKCADDAIECVSHDYGGGAISCNNIHIRNVYCLSNGGRGVVAAGGDSMLSNSQIGYNGLTGVSASGWGTISDCLIWNNQGGGMYIGSGDEPPIITGNKIYDNKESGISLGVATSTAVITGNAILRNGDGGTGAAENSGIYVDSTETDGITISGNTIANNTATTTQDYGIYFAQTAARAVVEGNDIYGNTVDDLRVASPLNVRTYSKSVTVTTSGLTLFDVSATGFDGVVYDVTVAHVGGANAAHCRVLGDTASPLIVSQSNVGSGAFTFSISSGNLVVTSTGSDFTSAASFSRVV